MNKKIIAIVLAVLTVAMCFVFAACSGKTTDGNATNGNVTAGNTESDLAYLQDKGKMVIGMTIYEPMNYKDENGEWTGFDTELAYLVGEKLGVEVEFFEIADWDNKFVELETKNIDSVWNGMTINEDALNNSSVTNAYLKNAQVVVMKADKIEDYKDVESMKELSFAVEQGSAGEKVAAAAGLSTTAVKYQADALLEVKSGAADACVIDLTMAKAMTGEGTTYSDLAYSLELETEEFGISFRKDSDVTAKVNEIMAELKEDGTLAELAEKYGLVLAD